METIVFFYPKIGMGGTQTLILRLMRWYITYKYRTVLLTLNNITDDTILKDLNGINKNEYYVYNEDNNYFCTPAGEKLLFEQTESVTVLTFFLSDFLITYSRLSSKKYGCKFKHRIYCVHSSSPLLLDIKRWNLLIKPFNRLIKRLIKPFIRSLIKRKMLIFMSESSREACINYYKLNDANLNFEILRLPMEITRTTVSKSKNDNINILSIARFDFPFKGYILGLIDAFKTIALSTNNITLTIIGYGEGEAMVNQKVAALPVNIRKRIKILNKIPYSEIVAYIDKCDLFVGMGTTALDAANRNKICIVPVSYQENDLSTGFFYDDYTNVGACYNPRATYHHFPELISQVLSVDDEKFIASENLSKSLLVKYYDIDKIAPLFVVKEFCHFYFFEKVCLMIVYFYFFTRNIGKKIYYSKFFYSTFLFFRYLNKKYKK